MITPKPSNSSRVADGRGPTVRVHDDPLHGLVAHKQGSAPRILRETAVLEVCAHPGVVRLVGRGDDETDETPRSEDDTAHLRTHWVGGHTLATVPRPSPAECAGLLAALATTVADLHEGGVVHGAIVAEHVLVDRSGRPVLCSLGSATAPGIDAPADAPGPSDDICALGELLHHLLGRDADEEPLPHRRFGRRGEWRRHERRALRNLADLAIDDDPDRRPNARRFAASIADAVPGAVLSPPPADGPDDRRPGPAPAPAPAPSDLHGGELCDLDDLDRLRATMTEPQPRRSRDRRRLAVGGVVLALVLTAAGGRSLLRREANAAAQTEAGPVASGPAPTTPACPGSSADGTTLDVDGDGCADQIDIDGIEVTVGEQTWQVGAVGDMVTVGDWNCDGRATPAVLRPATGEVFVFTTWAAPDADLSVSPAAAHPGAIGFVQGRDAACSTLDVIDDAGTPTRITPPIKD